MADPDEKPLRAVTAANAGPMTGPGTTTFVVGRGEVAVIDPGPDDPAHLAALLAAVAGERVTAILVTHAHLDHSALAPRLAAVTGAEVLAFGAAGEGLSPLMARLLAEGLSGGGEGVDAAFRPDRRLADGALVTGPGWRLQALHLPGHMAGHLCFAWDDWLFTGDQVMAWAPSLVSPPEGDMGAYMASLERLSLGGWARMLPTHGPAIGTPAARLAELLAHRRGREAQVLAAVRAGAVSLAQVTAAVYPDLAPALLPAASRNALAHLIDLAERSLIRAEPYAGPQARFLAR